MEEKHYYFSNYPKGYLLALLNQTERKLLTLKSKNISCDNKLAYKVMNYLKTLTVLMRECLTNRFLSEEKTLTAYGKMLLTATGLERDILKDVFTIKLLENNNLIEVKFLDEILNNLDIDHLQKIIDGNINSLYTLRAKERYSDLLFQVDEEAQEELKQKIKNDRKYY